MVLINCPECELQVSSQAPSCPGCGFPVGSSVLQTVEEPRSSSQDFEQLGKNITTPVIDQVERKSGGGALGAFVGAFLGYALAFISCDMNELMPDGFVLTLIFSSPTIIIGMLLGYFLGRASG